MYRVEEAIDRYLELIKKHVLEVFDEIASSYSYLRSKPWSKVIEELLPYIKNHTERPIADLGSGSGRHSIPLAFKGYRVVAMDLSYRMISILLSKAKKRKIDDKIDLLVGDILFMPFRDRVFNAVILIAVLHHIPQAEIRKEVLKNIKRKLIENGVILITVWSLIQPRYFIKAIIDYIIGKVNEFGDILIPWHHRGKKLLRFYHLFRKREIINLVKESGYKLIKEYTYNPTRKFFPQNYVIIAQVKS